ncbi:metal-dependent hydrolase [Halovivax sp.]|uniref:metal-dependent hydrolase n=1 Tax=Halovivax sp. TaxID=1935978 RepID=UPI0025C34CC3|nr:metal-dependent hydrolase [Halovivax sp.]
MWPWEHAIVGYVAYSLFCHLYYRDSPDGPEAFAVIFASVLPDLIDKPLAWEYGVFESGYALGHSIFVAVPLSIAVGLLARRWGRGRAGLAFAVGYLLHLPADVLDGYYRGDVVEFGILLWPVERGATYHEEPGFADQFVHFLGQYRAELTGGDPSTYVLAQLGLAGLAALLWLYDGAPILRECALGGKRAGGRLVGGLDRRLRSLGERE